MDLAEKGGNRWGEDQNKGKVAATQERIRIERIIGTDRCYDIYIYIFIYISYVLYCNFT